jgi:hypothetical protein
MSYAVRKDGQGWRSINSAADISVDEDYSDTQPAPITPDPKDAIRAQIKSMEDRENLPRVSREFMLGTFEAQFPANVLAQHEGYVRLKAFDAQIKALRDQL